MAETAEIAYIGRNEKGEWGLALGSAAQLSLIDLMGTNFSPLYRVIGPIIFFMSFLLLVWGALWLVVTIFLRVAIIIRYRGCGVWVLTAFWGTSFQPAMSPFNWIDGVMQDVGRKVGMMLESEAIRGPGAEEADEQNVENLRKKYPWWLGSRGGETGTPTRASSAETEDIVILFVGKSTKV